MPRVIITEIAVKGLKRCRQFLKEKNPRAAKRAGQIIGRSFNLLESQPDIGRPLESATELRELIINFGDSGYVALYRYDVELGEVYILAVRHQKEAGF